MPEHNADARADAQRDRDAAEVRRQQARAAAAAHTDGDREVIEAEAKLGRGPSGLNNGPSNTVDADPYHPAIGASRHDGMGMAPPRSPPPTSDKPEYRKPAIERAARLPEGHDPRAREAGKLAAREHKDARRDEARASAEIADAQGRIADTQSRDGDRDRGRP